MGAPPARRAGRRLKDAEQAQNDDDDDDDADEPEDITHDGMGPIEVCVANDDGTVTFRKPAAQRSTSLPNRSTTPSRDSHCER